MTVLYVHAVYSAAYVLSNTDALHAYKTLMYIFHVKPNLFINCNMGYCIDGRTYFFAENT